LVPAHRVAPPQVARGAQIRIEGVEPEERSAVDARVVVTADVATPDVMPAVPPREHLHLEVAALANVLHVHPRRRSLERRSRGMRHEIPGFRRETDGGVLVER